MQIQNPFQLILPQSLQGAGLILPFEEGIPKFGEQVFLAPGSSIIGDATLSDYVSVWFGTVIRADIARIEIGNGSNIQDNCTLHVGDNHPCLVGSNVVVGHSVVLHGCVIEDDVTVGMGSVVLNGAVIEKGAVLGAGSLVPPGMRIPANTLALGHPAKVIRPLSEEEKKEYAVYAPKYVRVSQAYRRMFEQIKK